MTDQTERQILKSLQTLPNIGPACAKDLYMLGYRAPENLRGEDPVQMFENLCSITGKRHDPCVLDTFMSVVSFANGGPARPWWHFTAERKELLRAKDAVT